MGQSTSKKPNSKQVPSDQSSGLFPDTTRCEITYAPINADDGHTHRKITEIKPTTLKVQPTNAPQDTQTPQNKLEQVNLSLNPLFKNTNQNTGEIVWIYRSYSKRGWWFTSPESNQRIEHIFEEHRRGDYNLRQDAQVNNDTFTYDFGQMTQTSSRRTVREIRRMDRYDLDEWYNDYVNEILNLDQDHIWFYQTRQGYRPYMKEDQETIEQRPENQPLKFISANGYTYRLDFKNMMQLRQGVSRRILSLPKELIVEALLNPSTQEAILKGYGIFQIHVSPAFQLRGMTNPHAISSTVTTNADHMTANEDHMTTNEDPVTADLITLAEPTPQMILTQEDELRSGQNDDLYPCDENSTELMYGSTQCNRGIGSSQVVGETNQQEGNELSI